MSVTIRDVARAAGVSVATVSRVLNGTGPVSDAARGRIDEATLALRYAPNGAARSLSTRTTHTLGVLLPDLHGEFFSEVIRGADQAARASGYHLLVSSSHADRSEVEAALRAMRGRVDGLVVMSPDVDARGLAANLPDALPVVLLNSAVDAATERLGPRRALHAIGVDNYGGAYAMVRHLAALGHRRIAIITGSQRNHDAEERLRGYRAAVADAGLAAAPELEIAGDFSDEAGYRAGRAVLALDPRPTALFASNDVMAVSAIGAMRERGVRVPHEMAVGGFDDIPLARYVSPPLTTVHVDNAALGARAVAELADVLRAPVRAVRAARTPRITPSAAPEGAANGAATPPAAAGLIVLPATLVVRASCGALEPRAGAAAAMPPPPAS